MTPAQKNDPETLLARWYFARPHRPQRQRNSKLDEHFAGSGSDRAGDLVREGTQNAGDAARPGAAGPVRIRIAFGELPAKRIHAYVSGLLEHVPEIAKQTGMASVEAVSNVKTCQILTFEDFNTTGLTGDPLAERRYDGDAPNAFHTFFRAEGQTDKVDERKQGSKGVGKVTFLAASMARAVLGITCRHDDGRVLLFGTAVLHTHRLEGKDYDGDAWYGRPQEGGVEPVEDPALIETFCEDFGLIRAAVEPGFSIVVPWLDTDPENGITPDRIIDSVLRDHAWPILQGKIVIEVVSKDGSMTTIDSAHFLSVLEARPDLGIKAQVGPMAELCVWALAHPPTATTDRLGLHKQSAPAWSDPDLISPEQRDRLQAALEVGDPVAVRVLVRIRAKGRAVAEVQSFFDLFLQRDATSAAAAGPTVQFIRSGMLVSGMGRRLPGFRGLIVAEDTGVAALLRAAENPSHTKWNAKPIKDTYTFAAGTLNFIVESAKGVATLLAGDTTEKDSTIWASELSLPAGDEFPSGSSGKDKRKRKIKVKTDATVIPPPPPRKRPYDVAAVSGSLVVRPSGRPFPGPLPARLELQLAYHVRGKDPLKHYAENDFDLTDVTDFPIHTRGCSVAERTPNTLAIEITDPDFELNVSGFDTHRELFCKPRLEGACTVVDEPEEGDDNPQLIQVPTLLVGGVQ